MKELTSIQFREISGGMIGAPSGSPYLAVGDSTSGSTRTYTYDDGSTITYHANGSVTATEGDSRALGTVIGAVTGGTLCVGAGIPSGGATIPAVPYCVAVGGFLGNLVGGSGTSGTPPGGVTGGYPFP